MPIGLCLFLLFLTVGQVSAQKLSPGIVKGIVKTSDNEPAGLVTILIKETNQQAMTNATGHYIFKSVKPGTYTLVASFVGLGTQTQQVSVTENDVAVADFVLADDKKKLQEVQISGRKNNKYLKKETDDISRLPLRNLENPQVYSVVTSDLMKEQVISNYVDAFKNVPGAGVPLMYNNGRSTMLSRGFTTPNFVRNGIAGYDYNSIDPANIEKLEAIKGPSGTLFNSSIASFGGLFNRVTKKPFETAHTEVGYQGGSFDQNRLTADVNAPLNEDKTVLFRVNTALASEHSFQDAGFTRSIFVAPSIIYKVNDRLSIQFDAEISSYSATSAYRLAPDAKGKIFNVKDLGIDYKRSFGNNGVAYTSSQVDIFGQVNYKISDEWKSQTIFSKVYSNTKGYVTQLSLKGDSISQQATKEDYPYYVTNIQQNFIGDFKIAGLRNRLIVGLEYYNQKSNWTNITVNAPAINYRNPGTAYNNFNADKISTLVTAAKVTDNAYVQNGQSSYAAYASDVLNITDNLNAMLSLRVDRFVNAGAFTPSNGVRTGNFSQTALSPKFGLVYQVVKDQVSVFGNYMNGFNNVTSTSFDGSPFKPQYANQWEGGVKVDLWDHKISSTISYYDISVSNTVRVDPDHTAFNIQDGTQLSKGIEAEVIANPFVGFNIIAGYAYNNSKFTKADASVLGLRPAAAGPDKLANLWISYRIPEGAVKGLGFGAGGNYGSSSFQTNTAAFKFVIPSYTTIDATAFYDQPKYRIGVKVDNLTNEKYWSFRLAPQNPTRFTLSLNLKF